MTPREKNIAREFIILGFIIGTLFGLSLNHWL